MRNILIGAAILVFAGAMAMAQSQADNTSTTPGTHETTVSGCLGGGPGHYTILTREGKTIKVQTDDPKAEKLVGHTVVASGSETPGARTSQDTAAGFPNAKNTGEEAVFTAGTVVDMSPTCKQQTTKAKPSY